MNCQGCGEPLTPARGPGPAKKWCSARCRKRQYDLVCEDCGGRMDGTTPGNKATPYCHACASRRRGERRHIENRAFIEAMWADGLTIREIGAIAGWTTEPSTHISVLRGRGYDLPHRRTPEQIARITAGSSENLAKARAVYRESRAS